MRLRISFALSLALLLFAAPAHGQTSIGVGIASAQGDFGDVADNGYTIRAQRALSLLGLVAIHAQGGWSRFEAKGESSADADILHAGVGARLGGFGLVFVGANAAYFFGDGDDEIGFFPEVGIGLGPLEVVADYRLGSDFNWFGLRGALKF
jgi:hypothetical protein